MIEIEIGIDQLQVIVVEPSHTQQRIIIQRLQQLGIEDIHCVEAGSKGLELIQVLSPNLIISALYLPDMTGDKLLEALRSQPQESEIAFILISSETNIRYLEPFRQAGVIALLPKPYSIEELKLAIDSTLHYLNPQAVELDRYEAGSVEILLVDDSAFALKYIGTMLQNMGFTHITTADNAHAAVDLIENRFFDLIITDYHMPEMDGHALTAYIREQSSQPSVPILMVTSEQNESRLAIVHRAGVSALCDKPIEPQSFQRLIENLLGEN